MRMRSSRKVRPEEGYESGIPLKPRGKVIKRKKKRRKVKRKKKKANADSKIKSGKKANLVGTENQEGKLTEANLSFDGESERQFVSEAVTQSDLLESKFESINSFKRGADEGDNQWKESLVGGREMVDSEEVVSQDDYFNSLVVGGNGVGKRDDEGEEFQRESVSSKYFQTEGLSEDGLDGDRSVQNQRFVDKYARSQVSMKEQVQELVNSKLMESSIGGEAGNKFVQQIKGSECYNGSGINNGNINNCDDKDVDGEINEHIQTYKDKRDSGGSIRINEHQFNGDNGHCLSGNFELEDLAKTRVRMISIKALSSGKLMNFMKKEKCERSEELKEETVKDLKINQVSCCESQTSIEEDTGKKGLESEDYSLMSLSAKILKKLEDKSLQVGERIKRRTLVSMSGAGKRVRENVEILNDIAGKDCQNENEKINDQINIENEINNQNEDLLNIESENKIFLRKSACFEGKSTAKKRGISILNDPIPLRKKIKINSMKHMVKQNTRTLLRNLILENKQNFRTTPETKPIQNLSLVNHPNNQKDKEHFEEVYGNNINVEFTMVNWVRRYLKSLEVRTVNKCEMIIKEENIDLLKSKIEITEINIENDLKFFQDIMDKEDREEMYASKLQMMNFAKDESIILEENEEDYETFSNGGDSMEDIRRLNFHKEILGDEENLGQGFCGLSEEIEGHIGSQNSNEKYDDDFEGKRGNKKDDKNRSDNNFESEEESIKENKNKNDDHNNNDDDTQKEEGRSVGNKKIKELKKIEMIHSPGSKGVSIHVESDIKTHTKHFSETGSKSNSQTDKHTTKKLAKINLPSKPKKIKNKKMAKKNIIKNSSLDFNHKPTTTGTTKKGVYKMCTVTDLLLTQQSESDSDSNISDYNSKEFDNYDDSSSASDIDNPSLNDSITLNTQKLKQKQGVLQILQKSRSIIAKIKQCKGVKLLPHLNESEQERFNRSQRVYYRESDIQNLNQHEKDIRAQIKTSNRLIMNFKTDGNQFDELSPTCAKDIKMLIEEPFRYRSFDKLTANEKKERVDLEMTYKEQIMTRLDGIVGSTTGKVQCRLVDKHLSNKISSRVLNRWERISKADLIAVKKLQRFFKGKFVQKITRRMVNATRDLETAKKSIVYNSKQKKQFFNKIRGSTFV